MPRSTLAPSPETNQASTALPRPDFGRAVNADRSTGSAYHGCRARHRAFVLEPTCGSAMQSRSRWPSHTYAGGVHRSWAIHRKGNTVSRSCISKITCSHRTTVANKPGQLASIFGFSEISSHAQTRKSHVELHKTSIQRCGFSVGLDLARAL